MNAKRQALGRGLSALLQDADEDISINPKKYLAGSVANIPIELIEANPFQPRSLFEEEALAELSESIKHQGIIQPITVRISGENKFQIIAGERRLRASQIAGLDDIPAYIRTANDDQMLEMAIVENLQRENLNAIEISICFQRLIEECNLTQEKLSERVGKDRSTITNYIRLLKLPAEIQVAIRDNKISMGHARALISVDKHNLQLKILKEIIEKTLSVRAVEQLVKKLNDTKELTKAIDEIPTIATKFLTVKNKLSKKLQAKVNIRRSAKGKGSIVIAFSSEDEFDKIIRLLDNQ
jgi:ParB family chromosome partitioning protein